MQDQYFKLQGIPFVRDALIDNRLYDLLPVQVLPSLEMIKNTERSLDGTMSVDIVAGKQKLKVVFGLLDNDTLRFILDLLKIADPHDIRPEELTVEYYDLWKSERREIVCYLDDISFTPFVTEDGVKWQDVTLDLCEL